MWSTNVNKWLIVCCSFESLTIPYVCVHQIDVTLHSHYIFLPAHSLSTASASFSGASASKEGHSLRQRWTHPHYTWTGNYNSQFTLVVHTSWYFTDVISACRCYVNCTAVCTCSNRIQLYVGALYVKHYQLYLILWSVWLLYLLHLAIWDFWARFGILFRSFPVEYVIKLVSYWENAFPASMPIIET